MIHWFTHNGGRLGGLLEQHVVLTLWPLAATLVLSIPLGAAAARLRWLRRVLLPLSGVLYTIPSLALFLTLPSLLGTRVLDPVNVVVALSIYGCALMVRTATDAFSQVPATAREAATAIGYGPARRFLTVDLPLAAPVLLAGTRVVAVSTVSLVSVGALIGVGGLGVLFTTGYQRSYPAEVGAGIVTILALALLLDGLLLGVGRLLMPWRRATAPERRSR